MIRNVSIKIAKKTCRFLSAIPVISFKVIIYLHFFFCELQVLHKNICRTEAILINILFAVTGPVVSRLGKSVLLFFFFFFFFFFFYKTDIHV